ncbi:hypothetical protein BLAT2472_11059 [Burkholderia latens]
MVPVRRSAVGAAARRHRDHPDRRARAGAQLSARPARSHRRALSARLQKITVRNAQPVFNAGFGPDRPPLYYQPLQANRIHEPDYRSVFAVHPPGDR